jgi:hypothetical protein
VRAGWEACREEADPTGLDSCRAAGLLVKTSSMDLYNCSAMICTLGSWSMLKWPPAISQTRIPYVARRPQPRGGCQGRGCSSGSAVYVAAITRWHRCQLGDKGSAAFIALVLTLFIALIPGPGFRQELVSRRISEYRCAGKGADRSDSSNPRGHEKSRL